MADNSNFKIKLTKKDLRKSWWRWVKYNLAAMSFERLEGTTFAYSLAPIFKKLYKSEEDQCAALERHSVFYNTEPQLGSVVNGIVTGLEEAKANGEPVEDELMDGVKTGLMGPIAGVGDTIVQGIAVPLLLSIGMGLSVDGSVLGPLFYTVTWFPLILFASYWCYMKGYSMGIDAVDLLVGEKVRKFTEAFTILGVTVMGGLSASFINLNIAAVFDNGTTVIDFQALLDKTFPKLLPLVLVLASWKLLQRKDMSPLKLMGIFLIVAAAGVLLGIF